MDAKERALAGALSGAGGTLVLSGLHEAWSRLGLVFETTPTQVVDRAEELGLVKVSSSWGRRLLTGVAHLAYGVGTGAALGLLRRNRGGATEEAAVGSALGILAWSAGWTSWLPLTGAHEPPWMGRSPKVLLPVLDHAAFGAAWSLIYWALTRKHS
jgi:hypothetical protein